MTEEERQEIIKGLSKTAGEESGGTDSVQGGVLKGIQIGGSTGNPWGAAIGGVIGGIAGGLSAKNKRRAANAKADAEDQANKIKIEGSRSLNEQSILKGLANNLSQTLLR